MDFRRVRIISGTIISIALIFLIWYKVTFSMSIVTPYEINPKNGEHSILIATQGSYFKEAIVSQVTNRLDLKNIYFRITDVEELHEVSESDWDAIFILHTWEISKPPASVKSFLQGKINPKKTIVISTSGGGTESIKGWETITSESDLKKAPEISERVVNELNIILNELH